MGEEHTCLALGALFPGGSKMWPHRSSLPPGAMKGIYHEFMRKQYVRKYNSSNIFKKEYFILISGTSQPKTWNYLFCKHVDA